VAGTDYSLRIVVDADDRASRTLTGLRGTLAELGGHFQTLGTVALGGLGALAGAAAGAGAAIAKLAVDAAPLESVRGAFVGLAESAGVGADEMLAALERGSAGMVSQRDLMLSFNRAAQLVGEDFAVQLPDAMQYLSKAAAATGQDMDYMLNSLVVGVGRLSPMILDNLCIQVSLEEATARAAEKFGVQADELSKSQLQAGMMAVVMEKLRENTAAMPDVTGTASTGLAQLRATFQNAKDTIGAQFVPALAEVLNAAMPLAQGALPLLAGVLQTYAVPAINTIAGALSTFVGALRAGQSPLDALRAALATFLPPELLAQFDSLRAGVESVIDAVRPYAEQVAAWVGENVKLQDVLIVLGVAIATVVVPALASVVSAAAPVVGVFLLAVAIVAALREAWENNFLGIRDITASVIEFVRGLIAGTTAFIRDLWQQHGDEVMAIVQLLWDHIQTIIGVATDIIKSVVAAFQSALSGDWYAFGENLRAAWDRIWSGIVEILSSWTNVLRETVGKLVNSIVEWFRNVDWGQVGRDIISGIANGISAAAGWLADAARDAARAALESAKGFLGIRSPSKVFEEVGRQTMAGWARGIEMSSRLPAMRTREVAGGMVGAATAGGGMTIQTVVVYADEPETLLRRLQAYA